MSKLVVSLDGVVIKDALIVKDRTTLGRRPYNDIVIDNLAVSGEHAAILKTGAEVWIEDLNSTNGTYINGKAIKKRLLSHNDTVEIGKYKIKYLEVDGPGPFEKTMVVRSSPGVSVSEATAPTQFDPVHMGFPSPEPDEPAVEVRPPVLRVLTGSSAGRETLLTKPVTTFGKPGVQVCSIRHEGIRYLLVHVEGGNRPRVNGLPMPGDEFVLADGDLIELAGGTQLRFNRG